MAARSRVSGAPSVPDFVPPFSETPVFPVFSWGVPVLSRLLVTEGRLASASNGFLCFSTTRVTSPRRLFKEADSRRLWFRDIVEPPCSGWRATAVQQRAWSVNATTPQLARSSAVLTVAAWISQRGLEQGRCVVQGGLGLAGCCLVDRPARKGLSNQSCAAFARSSFAGGAVLVALPPPADVRERPRQRNRPEGATSASRSRSALGRAGHSCCSDGRESAVREDRSGTAGKPAGEERVSPLWNRAVALLVGSRQRGWSKQPLRACGGWVGRAPARILG